MTDETTLPAEGSTLVPATTDEQPAAIQAPDTGTEQTPQTEQETQPAHQKSEDDEKATAQKRIDRLTREKWEARRQTAALEARLQEIERQQQTRRNPNAPLTPADVDRLAEQKAVQLREQETFNDRCNEVFENGVKEIPGFEAALAGFRTLGGLPPTLVEAALESDAPAKVLNHLGSNLEEAEGLLKLSPARLGAAVAKLAAKVASAPAAPVSKAPPPIRPLTASGTVSDMEPKDVREWMEWRRKQLNR